MGHRNQEQHQTLFLFLFVLPSCMKRLEACNPRFTNCSVITVFAPNLVTVQINKLLHIFWLMNRGSLFSPVFSEIDEKAARLLLSNIRLMTGTSTSVSTPGRTEVSESSTTRSVSVTSVAVTLSSSPRVSAVASTGHQRVNSIDSSRDSATTSTNATTSVVNSSATPVCSLLPSAASTSVSIQPTPTIIIVMPAVTSNSHAFTHSLHSVVDGQDECIRRLLTVSSTSITPPILTPTNVCSPRTTIAASISVPTDSETTTQDMSIGHLRQSPVCMYVPTFLCVLLFL